MKALVEAAMATKAATSDLSMVKQIYLLENANGVGLATSVQCGIVKVASACVLMWWSRRRRQPRQTCAASALLCCAASACSSVRRLRMTGDGQILITDH